MNKNEILSTLKTYLDNKNMFVVGMSISGDNLIKITIDGDTRVTLDDCIDVTKHIENQYDRDTEDYELRVSSFGIDKPMETVRQLNKVIGDELLIKLPDGEEQRARLDSIEGNLLHFTWRIKKGGVKQKALVFKDGEKAILPFESLNYIKEIICF
ncbi:MAG: hypothetical protein EOL88_09725 [Bacteroidia bacterium]|nr:hypothetical protein [Bacteroidia bacterium]